MKTIVYVNLKGGVGKTITSLNTSFEMAARGKKVLLIDCDKQGNSSKFMGSYGNAKSLADVLLEECEVHTAIQKTGHENIDIITANMSLINANTKIAQEMTRPRERHLKDALDNVKAEYDYCFIDCAPDINISVINALVAADLVIIPFKCDRFAFDGMREMLDQIQDVKKYYNPELVFGGVLLTSWRNNEANNQSLEGLEKMHIKVYGSKIRWTKLVDESTFASEAMNSYSPRSAACRDYVAFCNELEVEING